MAEQPTKALGPIGVGSRGARYFGQRVGPSVRAFYPVRTVEVGASAISDISGKQRAAASVTGFSKSSAWVPYEGGGYALDFDGVNDELVLEDNLFDSLTEGSIVLLVRAPDQTTANFLSDFQTIGGSQSLRIYAVTAADVLFFQTGTGGTLETLGATNKMRWGEWITVGAEWSAGAGKKLFLNGALVASNSSLTGASSTGSIAPRIGSHDGAFSVIECRSILSVSHPIGEANHHFLNDFLRRGIR